MPFFRLYSRRVEVEIPVVVNLYGKKSNKPITDPVPGTLINFSKYGSCLIVEKVIVDGEHLFFSAQKKSGNYLNVKGEIGEFAGLDVLCQSVWMDGLKYKEKSCFKIGLQFNDEQKSLYKLCKKSFS